MKKRDLIGASTANVLVRQPAKGRREEPVIVSGDVKYRRPIMLPKQI